MPLIVAACSNRKRPSPAVRATTLAPGPLAATGAAWLLQVQSEPVVPASDLYCGRSVRTAQATAQLLGGQLLFASAGLGWVSADQLIPSYGMTVVAGDDNVLSRLRPEETAASWWSWLGRHSPFATSLREAAAATDGLILVALPRAYLLMIEGDLIALAASAGTRLRIVQRETAELSSLAPWTLRYDDRLEGSANYAGTKSDFAARAGYHFAQVIWPNHEGEDIAAHNRAINTALSGWTLRTIRPGLRRSDAELQAIVAEHWDAAQGRTTKLLRVLRDDLGIACEQGRFARLVNAMRAEREQIV